MKDDTGFQVGERDAPTHLREPGFIVDHGHGNARQKQERVESDVAKSFWVGIHSKSRATRHVRTYRCPRCGYLESYADDSDA